MLEGAGGVNCSRLEPLPDPPLPLPSSLHAPPPCATPIHHPHLTSYMQTPLGEYHSPPPHCDSFPCHCMYACVCALQSGVLIRGNLRADRLQVFEAVCDKVNELFGSKYAVLMIEDPEALSEAGGLGGAGGPGSDAGSSSSSSKGGSTAAVQEPRIAFQVGVRHACVYAAPARCWVLQGASNALQTNSGRL